MKTIGKPPVLRHLYLPGEASGVGLINGNPNEPVLKISSITNNDAANIAKEAKEQREVENVKQKGYCIT